MIKLIVSDMDGTILNSSKKLTEKTKDAIRFARINGVNFTIATGRMYSSAAIFARQLDVNLPIIACNGALIKNHLTKEVLYEKPIVKSNALQVCNVLDDCGLYYHMYTQDKFFTKELKYTSLNYWNNNKTAKKEDLIDIEIIDNFISICNDNYKILKFVAIEDECPEKLINAKNIIADLNGLEVSKSWENNLEIMAKDISKGNALSILANIYGYDMSEVLALGDQQNDISMIEKAGMGVAMDNADEYVKSRADFITESNDLDGVANAIMNLFK